MAAKCWKFIGQGENNNDWYEFFFCGTTATTDGTNMIVDGVNRQRMRKGTVSVAGAVSTPVQRDQAKVANDASRGDCSSCSAPENQPDPKYDCLNGACIPNTTYKTPGLYQSLSECQQICGTGCSGLCINASDWAAIEGLSSQNKSKHCG